MARRKPKPKPWKVHEYTTLVRGTPEQRSLAYREMLKNAEGKEIKVVVVESWKGPFILKGSKLRNLLRDAGALEQTTEAFIPRRKFDAEADIMNRNWG